MKTAHRPDDAGELKRLVVDVLAVVAWLGVSDRAIRQAHGYLVRCVWHEDTNPSMSLQLRDGIILANCFACAAAGDIFDLIAARKGLSVKRDFDRIRKIVTELAGVPLGGRPPPPPPPAPASAPMYPLADELAGLWVACGPVLDDAEVTAWLRSRALDAGDLEHHDLARALPSKATLPRWARTRFGSWTESGHRLVIPAYDHLGTMVSVRGRRVIDAPADAPKELVPTGYTTGGLVMACPLARMLLATGRRPDFWPATVPLKLVVTEGGPDYLTWATKYSEADGAAPATLGIGGGGSSGTWNEAIAARIPDETRVVVWTDHDEPGERYAWAIYSSLRSRCEVLRGAH